jgi:hypothetical protein
MIFLAFPFQKHLWFAFSHPNKTQGESLVAQAKEGRRMAENCWDLW